MAKYKSNKYAISYNDFKKKVLEKSYSTKEEKAHNFLLFLFENCLLEEILDKLGTSFIGKDYNPQEHLKKYYSDEKDLNDFLSETGNLDFFTEKSISLYIFTKTQNFRGFKKDDKESIKKYFVSPNPDRMIIFLVNNSEINFSYFEELINPNLSAYYILPPTITELKEWIIRYLNGYKVEEEAIERILEYVNLSYDEAKEELDKLKNYTYNTKIINVDSVNLCVGFSKEFDEKDFIKSILKRDLDKSLTIYKSLSLKPNFDLYVIGILNRIFVNISKIMDKNFQKSANKQRELQIYSDYDEIIKLYYNYMSNLNELKIKSAFDYIYKCDKMLKTSAGEKYSIMTSLIHKVATL
ncbi:MAG: hypothetical protein N2490_02785 [Ignavibacteria bacterium]|nr:hypothetical protein [Ignavibacteria bacterium]